jgi:hypothetical protein
MLLPVRSSISLIAAVALIAGTGGQAATEYDYAESIKAIAADIAGLRDSFPQIKEFSPSQNVLFGKLAIDYAYHTHRYEGRGGGWVAHAPNPDDDGIWLYIDLHDRDSQAQIDTQPVVPARCFGEKRAMFLILEGKTTKPLAGRLVAILNAHGVKPCS